MKAAHRTSIRYSYRYIDRDTATDIATHIATNLVTFDFLCTLNLMSFPLDISLFISLSPLCLFINESQPNQ